MNYSKYLDHLGIQSYHHGKINESVQFLSLAITEAMNMYDIGTELMSRGHLSEAYIKLGYYYKAIDSSTILLSKAKQENSKFHEMRGLSLLAMAILFEDVKGRWEEFNLLIKEALIIAREVSFDGYWVVQNLENLGLGHFKVGNNDQAVSTLQKAVSSVREDTVEADFFKARIFQTLAEIYSTLGFNNEAKDFIQTAYEFAIDKLNHAPHLLAGVKIVQAKMEYSKGELVKAHELLIDILRNSREADWRVERRITGQLLCNIELGLGRYDKAVEYSKEALQLSSDMKLKEEEIICLLLCGKSFLQVNQKAEAKKYLTEAKRKSEVLQYLDYQKLANKELKKL